MIEDIGHAFRVRITREIAIALETRRIFRHVELGREPVGEPNPVVFLKTTKVEPYVAFGGHFLTIGAFSYSHSHLPPELTVGRYCSIANGLSVLGERHPIERATSSVWSYRRANPVVGAMLGDRGITSFPFHKVFQKSAPRIGNDVWIGERVSLARGIAIGDGAVIGACAVVTKDVEPYCIVGGNPARVIRRRFPDGICERFLRVHWWDYALAEMPDAQICDPERFLDQIEDWTAAGKIKAYLPDALDADALVGLMQEKGR